MKSERKREEEEVAQIYAKALAAESHYEGFWRDLNEDIIERWSITALRRIKRRAWELAR